MKKNSEKRNDLEIYWISVFGFPHKIWLNPLNCKKGAFHGGTGAHAMHYANALKQRKNSDAIHAKYYITLNFCVFRNRRLLFQVNAYRLLCTRAGYYQFEITITKN